MKRVPDSIQQRSVPFPISTFFNRSEPFMRSLIALFLAASTGVAVAATQQQCEALAKPVEAKIDALQKLDEKRKENTKPSPQVCARGKEVLSMYIEYTAQADKLNCPFAFSSGQKIGGAAERADLIADLKKAYIEECR